MTIRLTKTESSTHVTPDSARVVYRVTVEFKTEADANDIARAFELVLLPRFTRDEAIVLVQRGAEERGVFRMPPAAQAHYIEGLRAALEALAAAGAFVDGHPCPCEQTDCPATMSAKLDAAGIR